MSGSIGPGSKPKAKISFDQCWPRRFSERALALFFVVAFPAMCSLQVSALERLPESLVAAIEETLEYQYLKLRSRLEADWFAHLAASAPALVADVSDVAGAIAAATVEASLERASYLMSIAAARNEWLQIQVLKNDVARFDSRLRRARDREEQARRQAQRVADLTASAASERAEVLAGLRVVEGLVNELAQASQQHTALLAAVERGAHPTQIAAQAARVEFNNALAEHQRRLESVTRAHADNVAKFNDWLAAQQRSLDTAQQSIDRAYARSSAAGAVVLTQRAKLIQLVQANPEKKTDGGPSGGSDAAAKGVVSSGTALREAVFELERARQQLLDAQAAGERLASKILSERQARESVLNSGHSAAIEQTRGASEVLNKRREQVHTGLAQGKVTTLQLVIDSGAAVASLNTRLRAQFGPDYRRLHAILGAWIGQLTSAPLAELPLDAGQLGKTLIERAEHSKQSQQSAVALSARLDSTVAALVREQAAYQRSQTMLIARNAAWQTLVKGLNQRYRRWVSRLAEQRSSAHAHLSTLAADEPALSAAWEAGRAAFAALELEYQQLRATLPDTSASAVSAEHWAQLHGRLQLLFADHSQLAHAFGPRWTPLLDDISELPLAEDTDSAVLVLWAERLLSGNDALLNRRPAQDLGASSAAAANALRRLVAIAMQSWAQVHSHAKRLPLTVTLLDGNYELTEHGARRMQIGP